MKKVLLLLVALFTFFNASAQKFAQSGSSASELTPEGWKIQETKGDLNKDGIADLVIIGTPTDPEHMHTREDGYVYNFNAPVLAIYWGLTDGDYCLYNQYNDIIPHPEDEYFFVDISMSVNERGALVFDVDEFASAGSYGKNNYSVIFRYQNDDFFLIGAESQEYSRTTGEAKKESYNFNTHKKQVNTFNMFDDSVPNREKWLKIPAKPLRRLGSFSFAAYLDD